MLTNAPVLSFYDPNLPTVVSSDASSYGIGGVLMQQHGEIWKPVSFCSCMLMSTEKGYAQIEKECLGCTWVCEKFSQYLLGMEKFTLKTDHKPLIPLINEKSIDRAPPRIQRLLLRLMPFRAEPVYTPGKLLFVADALSRSPIEFPNEDDKTQSDEIDAYIHSIKSSWPASKVRIEEIKKHTAEDPILQKILQYILKGWPDYMKDTCKETFSYFEHRGHLAVCDGIITYDDRIVIPKTLQEDILKCLHQGHWGVTKCRDMASECVWWIGMSNDIKHMIAMCSECQVNQRSQKHEPLIPTPNPEGPWLRIAADLFYVNNKNYIVLVDYYSKYLEIYDIASQKSMHIIHKFKCSFARFGIPSEVVSDNGPCFSSAEFKQFADECGFTHITTSPHFPQANGQAESAVKIAKKIMQQPDPMFALLNYRATLTTATGYSPAKLLLGRKIASKLPTLNHNLKPALPNQSDISKTLDIHKNCYANLFNNKYGVIELNKLQTNDTVRVKLPGEGRWGSPAKVISSPYPRSYTIMNQDGSVLRRNRQHLQHIKNPQSYNVQDVPPDDVKQNPPDADECIQRRSSRVVYPPKRLIEEN
jgi:hypothetical protein